MKPMQLFALIIAFALTGCAGSGPVDYAPLSFKRYQPIHVAVSSVQIVDEYKSPMRAPYVEHLIPYSPADAMKIWVRDRLIAVGGEKAMKVIIKDGSVKVTQISDGISFADLFSVGIDKRYDAVLDVEIRVYGDSPIAEADIAVRATRMITLPEDASVAERQMAFRNMISDLMTSINAELEKNIFAHMSGYISYSHNP